MGLNSGDYLSGPESVSPAYLMLQGEPRENSQLLVFHCDFFIDPATKNTTDAHYWHIKIHIYMSFKNINNHKQLWLTTGTFH